MTKCFEYLKLAHIFFSFGLKLWLYMQQVVIYCYRFFDLLAIDYFDLIVLCDGPAVSVLKVN